MTSMVGKFSEHALLQAGCIVGPPLSSTGVPGILTSFHGTLHFHFLLLPHNFILL